MAKFYCFSNLLSGKKKKMKEELATSQDDKKEELQLKPSLFEFSDKNSISIQVPLVNDSKDDKKELLLFDEKLDKKTATVIQRSHETIPYREQRVMGVNTLNGIEKAYEGGDEQDDTLSMRRDFSDFDLQAQANTKGCSISNEPEVRNSFSKNTSNSENDASELVIQGGHVSDPGMARTATFCSSPKLKRSCSNIENRSTAQPSLSSAKLFSCDDLGNIKQTAREKVTFGVQDSPLSAISSCSADRIMLKKHSSSQVLPSRSRKLWWKLFLWSHRNLHRSWVSKPRRLFPLSEVSNQKGGYTSDRLEPNHSANKQELCKNEKNQWVAFSMEGSHFDRINAWVNALDNVNLSDKADDDEFQGQDFGFTTHEVGESSRKNVVRGGHHIAEEVIQANNIIQSLNSLSSVANICGMGLRVLPAISSFSSLRSINLSNNFIVYITPGSLPKSLHNIDLSRNKITTIEGLRELTRLRVLNISYNRISRIGHGLSSCTLIKELYLAGNKISNVDGLHRLLKLNLLDLSFNKISTAKSLGQLVANYNSVLALNLLGNPIQNNIGDDQLRKAVINLLPNLTYLNKQPIKSLRATEVVSDSIARAALGDGGSRRRMVRRANQSSGLSLSARGKASEGSSHKRQSGSKGKHRSKSRY